MKYVVLWLVLVALPLPAWAARLDMTLYNQTETQQIQSLLLHTQGAGSGRLFWTTQTLPGDFSRYNTDLGDSVVHLALDMGIVRYIFNDCSALKDREVVTLELRLEGTGRKAVPVLTLREDASVKIQGQAEDLLPQAEMQKKAPTLRQIIAAKTMTEAAKLAGNAEYSNKGELFFSLSLGNVRWRATLVPELPLGTSNAWVVAQSVPTAKLESLSLMTMRTPQNVQATLKALYALGYRPWSVSMKEGMDKKLLHHRQMHKEGMTEKQAKAVTEEWLLASGASTENLLEGHAMLIPKAYYAAAESSAKEISPNACVFLRVNNTESMELRWLADCSDLMKYSR